MYLPPPPRESTRALIALCVAVSATAAADPGEPPPLRHPLLEDGARALLAAGMTPEEVLREVLIVEALEEREDGTVITTRDVVIPERERVRATEPRAEETPAPNLHPDLVDAFADPERAAEVFDVHVALADDSWHGGEVWSTAHMLHLLRGDIESQADVDHLRGAWVEARRTRGAAALDAFEAELPPGVEVVRRSPISGTLFLRCTVADLADLVDRGLVGAAEPVMEEEPQAGYAYTVTGDLITGYELMDLIQSTPFYQDPDHSGGYQGDEQLAMCEPTAHDVRRAHRGFDTSSTDSTDRFENCPGTGLSCTSNPSPSPGTAHSTRVASILIGDLTRGQDPLFTPCSGTSCHDRSGVARRATVLGIQGPPDRQVDVIVDRGIAVSNQSASNDADPECTGESVAVRTWHSAYEAGAALFNSGGNLGHPVGTESDCRMRAPATGIGVFAVAAYWVDGSHAEVLRDESSRGGTMAEGDGRSILALAAPSMIQYTFQADAAENPQYHELGMGITSASSPVVAGAAAIFRHWYLAEESTLIDDPSVLYTNLLLMGDRTIDNVGGRGTVGLSNLWGAGKLRLRKWDVPGLDAPARWATGSVCVNDGENVFIDLTPSGAIGTDVEIVKATAYWYDTQHDNGGPLDEITMSLQQRVNPNPPVWGTVAVDDSPDHKRLIYHTDPGAWTMRLRLFGEGITSDNQGGCGNNAMRVYYSALWEDSDRDDSDTPDVMSFTRPE